MRISRKSAISHPMELAGRLGKMTLNRQVATLALWPFLEQILSFLVATVDLLLSTRMAEGAERVAILDALGLGGYVMWLMMILQGSAATGVLAIVSRSAGARNPEEAQRGLTQGLFTGLATGIVSGFLIRALLPLLIKLFALSPEAGAHAMSYLSILCWTCPILGVLYTANNALRAIGNTRTPFLVMLAVNLINGGLSWLFVFGPEPFGGMGVRGLAWGSVLAWLAGAVIVVMVLFRKEPAESEEIPLSLRGASWKPDRVMMKRIVRIGIPQGTEMFGMWAIHAMTLTFITRLPWEGVLGAHFIAIRVESMSFLPGFAIGTAGATLIGQYLGAKNPEMAMAALKRAWLYAVVFMSVIGVLFLAVPTALIQIILPASDEQAAGMIALATPLVFLCGLFQPALATSLVMKTCLRGAGATATVMKVSFSSMFIFRVLAIGIGASYFGLGLVGIWTLMFCDVTVQAIIFSVIALRGKWRETKI
ncbi:MATE family efflux transporter [Akkermansiaceae bacterium]|nr:MATE family efflux transporter [Akkermansiaceae bacterium]MDB4458054.1 MATE family efflux transporter [Akkermansiaceae bacterium]MDB4462858.1 MATE family efflux transporter [Akkermansiaceae bacterium]MDB4506434.1 MATE family efflux transporter [bacterium]MDB4546416.1 MATE family efflux transporter [Akkermansiaceae bacterium]